MGRCMKISLLCQLLIIISLKIYRQEKKQTKYKFYPSYFCLNSTPQPSPSSGYDTTCPCMWLCGLSCHLSFSIPENRKRTSRCAHARVCDRVCVCPPTPTSLDCSPQKSPSTWATGQGEPEDFPDLSQGCIVHKAPSAGCPGDHVGRRNWGGCKEGVGNW